MIKSFTYKKGINHFKWLALQNDHAMFILALSFCKKLPQYFYTVVFIYYCTVEPVYIYQVTTSLTRTGMVFFVFFLVIALTSLSSLLKKNNIQNTWNIKEKLKKQALLAQNIFKLNSNAPNQPFSAYWALYSNIGRQVIWLEMLCSQLFNWYKNIMSFFS